MLMTQVTQKFHDMSISMIDEKYQGDNTEVVFSGRGAGASAAEPVLELERLAC